MPTAPPPIVKLRPKVESPSPEPEYDDERADRKRHLLERELEAKKKAPVRKKRKF